MKLGEENIEDIVVLGGDTNPDRTQLGQGGIERITTGLDIITSNPVKNFRFLLMAGKHPKHPDKPSLHDLTCEYVMASLRKYGYFFQGITDTGIQLVKVTGERVEIVPPPFPVWGSFEECMAAASLFTFDRKVHVVTDDQHRERVLLVFKMLRWDVEFVSSGPTTGGPDSGNERVKIMEAKLFAIAYHLGGTNFVRLLSFIKNYFFVKKQPIPVTTPS